ncbi:hypothetical protein [Arcobacter roscoffensis]|uniref:Uncharacterized protein n=1 Tax=Arcobacter roscoffensis TaxID=2961520 RepID=A0ABY5E2Z5_9BACT|nr:hypothetical protein [Arcobacter roscoffensis]UTJ06105.1 hypothetical protein NJU99_12750 [Arcobacter roscoffensis]
MKKFINYILTFVTIIAGLATIAGLYLQFYETKPILEIKTISKDNLTRLPSIEGLNAKYNYKDKEVKSLWKLHYVITNIGNEIIIGEGSKKNIIKENISFELNNKFKILEIENRNNKLPFKMKISNNNIYVSFLQWKPKESIEIIVYVEQLEEKSDPQLITNDREIINSEITYNTLEIEKLNTETSLYSKLPQPLQTAIWWFSIFMYGLFLLIMPLIWLSELYKKIKYKTWLKSNTTYQEWIDTLIQEGALSKYTEPLTLPSKLWERYPYDKPILPDNDFKSLTWGVLILSIFCLIPLLFMI